MLRQKIANQLARLLRAAIVRLSSDVELAQSVQAVTSTASYATKNMQSAKVCSSRVDVMAEAINASLPNGFICELGVYRGHSLNEIARRLQAEQIHGFDTFTGLPEFWREGFPEGTFDVSNENLEFESNCVLHKGLFNETLPVFLAGIDTHARLIHVDCDLYSSSICALRILLPRIRAGTVIVFDEYFNYPGWEEHEHKALLEFIASAGFNYSYIAYNRIGQQVAISIL